MPTNDSDLQIQARRILDAIAFIPFEQCQPLPVSLRVFLPVPASMQFGTKRMDYSTSVKQRACEVDSVVDTKLFFGHGLTNTMMRMFALQRRSFRIGETLRYYWS
jgi:hypothetical protein